ncbi:MAG: MCE family protein [Alphaproteobacteria bacterium]|nr:MCE family protein [Alphaproteobacteria bacterium]
MDERWGEISIGALVLLLGGVVLVGAYSGTGRADGPGYRVTAVFNRADGLPLGGEVRLSGVPVGRVVAQELDERFRAEVTLSIAPGIALPRDTAAAIHTDGMLGAKFVELIPGGSERMIPPGGQIVYTQDSLVLQELLQTIIAQARAARASQ